MSVRTVLVGVLALVFGLSAALGIQMVVQQQQQAAAKPPPTETVPVVMAAADIPRFTTITLDMLKLKEVPKEMVPSDALTRSEEALERCTLTFIGEGELVLTSKLAGKGIRGMATAIPNGMRAVTIRTFDVATSVGGFALPGSRVDVVLSLRGTGGGNDPTGGGTSLTILQNVEVLAVDQKVETPADQKVDLERLRSVTVLVTPEQGAKLQLGQNLGVLHLSLRNPHDKSVAVNAMSSLKDFQLPGAAAPDVPPAREQPKEKEKEKEKPVETKPPPPPTPPPILSLRGSQGSWTRTD